MIPLLKCSFISFCLNLGSELLAWRWSMSIDEVKKWFAIGCDDVFILEVDLFHEVWVRCGIVIRFFFGRTYRCKRWRQTHEGFIGQLPIAFPISQPSPVQSDPWQNVHCSCQRHRFCWKCTAPTFWIFFECQTMGFCESSAVPIFTCVLSHLLRPIQVCWTCWTCNCEVHDTAAATNIWHPTYKAYHFGALCPLHCMSFFVVS